MWSPRARPSIAGSWCSDVLIAHGKLLPPLRNDLAPPPRPWDPASRCSCTRSRSPSCSHRCRPHAADFRPAARDRDGPAIGGGPWRSPNCPSLRRPNDRHRAPSAAKPGRPRPLCPETGASPAAVATRTASIGRCQARQPTKPQRRPCPRSISAPTSARIFDPLIVTGDQRRPARPGCPLSQRAAALSRFAGRARPARRARSSSSRISPRTRPTASRSAWSPE